MKRIFTGIFFIILSAQFGLANHTDNLLVGPTINSVVVGSTNGSAVVTFNGGVYSDAAHTMALTNSSLAVSVSVSTGGGSVLAGSVSYTITHTAGAATATINFTITGPADGSEILTVTPTDGNSVFDGTGAAMSMSASGSGLLKDKLAPSGYSVAINQSAINAANKAAISFTFTAAETGGATYNYSFDDTDGATSAVTGSGTVASAGQTLSGIDLSSLTDGTITLTVTITDPAGNTGSNATSSKPKDVLAPSGYSVAINQSAINAANKAAISFTFTAAETGGATYNYSFDDTDGATSAVTGSGTVASAGQTLSGIDLSSLTDGTITLTVTITDPAGNTGSNATSSKPKDVLAPSGYSVAINQSAINAANKAAISFTFTAAETGGATYNYSFDDTDGATSAVTGSGTVASAGQTLSGIDLSSLTDGTITLTVTITDPAGNTGSNATSSKPKDVLAPSGYSVAINQSVINAANKAAISFTFTAAETGGATYNYSFDDTDGATSAVTGSGTVASAGQTLSGIDLSSLTDGTITLTVTITDPAGNTGSNATSSKPKDVLAPSGYSVAINQSAINAANKAAISFTFTAAETGGATYNYSFDDTDGATSAVTGSGTVASAGQTLSGIDLSSLTDGTITLTVTITDPAGNTGSNATSSKPKDVLAPSGYSVAINQSAINAANKAAISFTFTAAETGGATYNYSFDDTDGATSAVTGSGTVASAGQTISGIDLSSLTDGTITLTVTITDPAGNTGSNATSSKPKDVLAPSGYSVAINQSVINAANKAAISFTFTAAETGGATYNYSFDDTDGATSAVTGSGTVASAGQTISGIDLSSLTDGTITLTVTITDPAGNTGSNATSSKPKDVAPPTVTITRADPNPAAGSTASTLHFTVTFSEQVNGVDLSDFALTTGTNNDATGTIALTSGTNPGTTFGITVSSIVADYGSGTPANLSLDMTGATGIVDLATNPFGFSITNASYLVDDTPPTVVNNDFAYSTAGTGKVVFTISEPLSGTSINGFSIGGTIAGSPSPTTNPVGVFDPVTNTITLTNAGAAGTWPATITVSYTPPGSNKALDLAGNQMAAISATAVDVPNVNLQPGDIAFTVYDSKPTDGTHPDGFSFVILKDLPPQTKIFFTDNGWTGSVLQTGETTVTWTSPNSVTQAGTEVSYSSGTTCSIGTAQPSKTFDLHSVSGSSGDQVLAYQGSSGNPVLFIAAINVSGNGTIGANGWNSSIDNSGTNSNQSMLPSGLTAGTNAISFSSAPKDNVQYNKTVTTGSAQQLLAAMIATGNFNTTNGDATHYYTLTSSASNTVYKIRPVITAVTVADNKNYIVGSYTYPTSGVTITVHDDRGSAHTLNGAATPVSNIDGFTLTNLQRQNSTTYTADFTVTEGGTNIPVGTDIPISIDLLSAQGNSTAAVSPINTTQKFTTAIAHSNRVIDANSPTITSITNLPSTAIKVGALGLTVTVVYNESTTMNTSIQPPISLSGGSTHWGPQTPSGGTNGWTGNTYKATFTHDGTPEESSPTPISVQSSVAPGGAKDAAGNPNLGSKTSTAFTLDTKIPTLTAANITFDKSSVNVSNPGTSNKIRVSVKYSEQMDNTVAPTITFSHGTMGTGVPVGTNGWVTGSVVDDTYQIDYTNNTTNEEFSGATAVTATVSGGKDKVDNAQSGSTVSTATFDIDTKAPTVLSSNIVTTATTNATSLQWLVTFSEAVSGIDVTDFALATSGTSGTISGVSVISGSSVTVTVSSITGNGTLGLDVKTKAAGATLQDGGTNPLIGGFTGQLYTIDQTPPVVSSIVINSTPKNIGSTNGIVGPSVDFLVTFTETNLPLSGIDANGADFTVSTDGNVAWTTKSVNYISGNTCTVTISGITGTGRISIGLPNSSTIKDAAGNILSNSIAASFTGNQYYTIVLPEPFIDAAFAVSALTVTSTSITVTWNENATAQTPTKYLVLASTGTPTAPTDANEVLDGALAQNIPYGTNTATFSNLISGTVYNFAVYKYTLPGNVSHDNIDFELTKPAILNGTQSTVAFLGTLKLTSTPVSISSIKNAKTNSAGVMQFTINDDDWAPIVADVMTLHLNDVSQETITFNVGESLTLAEGAAVTGFSSPTNPGTIATAIYSGKGTTNIITLTSNGNGAWSSATTISYSPGNVQFQTKGSLQNITAHAVVQAADVVQLISSGNFVVPAGVTSIQVEAWGGGGSGGGSFYNPPSSPGGGGGGGGAYSRSLVTVTPGSSYSVSVGAGGSPVPATSNAPGNAGGQSTFGGTLVVAKGGNGGSASNSITPAPGGIGGQAASGTGLVKFSGGNGGAGSIAGSGGGGGSSAGTVSNGNPGSVGQLGLDNTDYVYGDYGIGGSTGGGDGGYGLNLRYILDYGYAYLLDGHAPGGGAGATNAGAANSGTGADGQVRITYSLPASSATTPYAADNSPFKFSGIVITQGTGNDGSLANWQDIIAGAELTDGPKTINSIDNPSDVTINPTNITFANIPSTLSTDLGFISDANASASSKTYTLNIWLRTDINNSLAATIDGLNLAFKVDPTVPANLTYNDVSISQKSSRLVVGHAAVESGTDQIQVVASKLVYHQPGSASPTDTDPQPVIGVNIPFSSSSAQVPEVYALDPNNNLDKNYTSTNSNNGTITNPAQGFGQSVGSLPFTNGKLSLSTFFFSAGSPTTSNTKIIVTGTGSPSVTPATSTDIWPVISSLSTISLGTAAPAIIPSTATSSTTAVQVFEFVVNDDFGAHTGTFFDNDILPTQLKQIKINPGGNNDNTYFNDWTQVIQGAELSDANGGPALSISSTPSASGVIMPLYLQFDLTQGSAMSNITDNGSNTYRLKIWLKSPMPTITLSDNIDNKYFDFTVDNNSITTFPNPVVGTAGITSTLAPSSATANTSGLLDQVTVAATQLDFTTQWAVNANQSYDAALTPSPVAKARDANQNLDTDWNTAHSKSGSVATATPGTYPLANPAVTLTNGVFTFDPALQVTSAGNGSNGASTTLVLTSAGIASTGISNAFVLNYSGNSDIIKDPAFVHGAGYTPDIPYISYQNTSFSANTDGVALEQFLIRDGGVGNDDTDGTATKLQAITLNLSNYQYLKTVALYDGTTKIAERAVAGNMTNVVGITGDLVFSSLAPFQANDDHNAALTVYATFIGTGMVDNQVIQVKVTSVTPGGVSSSFNAGGISTNFATLTSPDNQIEVVATQLDFTTPAAASPVSINTIVAPVIKARDSKTNVDLDFTGGLGVVTAFSNNASPTAVTMANGPVVGTTQFASGVLDFSVAFPSFQFTTGDNNETFKVSITGTGGITGSSPTLTLKTNTITPGILTEPPTISSLKDDFPHVAGGTNVFDFQINDDDNLTSGTDGLPTLISQIKITQLAGNEIANWQDLVASATLTDDATPTHNTITGTVNQTDITFNGITNTVGALGYITDNTSKTYTLNIVLRSALGGSLPSTVDNLKLAFEVLAPNVSIVTPGTGSSTFSTSEKQNSGTTTNAIQVIATKLKWTTEPLSSLLVTKDILLQQSPVPVIEAMDADNNRDLNYVTTLKVTNTESLPMVSTLSSETSGVPPFILSPDGASGTPNGGRYTFPTDFRYNDVGTGATGNGTMTAVTSAVNTVDNTNAERVSSVVTVGVGIATTITAGALPEPGTISSLVDLTHTPAGLQVFDFTINDDPTTPVATPANQDDGNPTRIKSITINQGTSNNVTDWKQAFAQVRLSDGTNSYIGTINATSLVFDGASIPYATSVPFANAASGDFGYVDDNTSKTYTLTVWLKTALGGTLPVDIDGKIFEFNVDATASSIVTDPHGTSIISTEDENSGPANNVVTVVATQLDVTTPAANRFVSINTPFTPFIQARDVNANRDLDFKAASGTVTAFDNSSSVTMLNGPVVSTTQFSLGVLDFSSVFPNFQFTSGNNNDLVTLSMTAGGLTTSISPILTLKTNTISPGALVEPTIISSLATSASGTNVFDFKINDDDFLSSGGNDSNETLPTLISQIKITQLAGNQIGNWQDLIASATLTDDVTPTPNTKTGTVNQTDITFSGIANAVGALGYVTDNTSKTYTLNIVLRSALGGSLPSTVDNLKIAFEVLAPNISIVTPGTGSSTFSTSEKQNSGTTTNAIQVIATKLKWTNAPWRIIDPAQSLLVNKDISLQQPAPVIEALDVDNNRDLNYVTSLNITDAGSPPLPMSSISLTQSSVTTFSLAAAGTAPLNGGIYNFPNDFQFKAIGNGTMTAVPSATTTVIATTENTSTPVTVRVGVAGTITPGALAEPTTISSLINDLTNPGKKVFDFAINDDPAGTPATEDDGNPTQISSITITQGTDNTITNWNEVFSQVQLDDGNGHSAFGAISATQLVFGPGLTNVNATNANANSADMGYIVDNGSKTYTLTVWLKTNLSGTQNYPVTIDGKNFVFEVLQANIGLNVNGTSIKPGENQNSGAETATVVATQLDITTPAAAITASLNVPIAPIIVESRDVNGNRDLDFNGIITAFTKTTAADSTINKPTVGVTAFTNGVYTFPNTFSFITGANNDDVTLRLRADNISGNTGTTCVVDAICSGISPTITLLTSFESFITKDPTFTIPATIPYVTHQEKSNNLTGSSYELIRVLLLDGSRSSASTYGGQPLQFQTPTETDGQPHGDVDGASTNLSSITIQISNPSNLRTIGLFDKNGVQLGSQIDVAAMNLTSGAPAQNFVFTGSPLLIAAADDSSAVFSVRASFNNTSNTVRDGDDIQIQLIAASLVPNSGTNFYNGSPANSGTGGPYVGGQVPNGSHSLGLIDVVATSLDLTTQPSGYAGINEPIGIDPSTTQPYSYGNPPTLTLMPTTSPGTVTARDKYALVDTGFAPATILIKDASNNSLLPPTNFAFTNGVMSLNGMQYPAVGNGKVSIITSTPSINSSTPTVNTTGTITTSTGSTTVSGVGTLFTTDVKVGSLINDANGNLIGTVASIGSNTSLTLNANALVAVTGALFNENSIPSQPVNVLDVTVTYDNSNGVEKPTIANPPGASLKGGNAGYNIFGLKFTANSAALSEPSLKGFTISFDVPYETPGSTIFQNFIIKEIKNAGTFDITSSSIGGKFTKGGSQAAQGIYDQIIVDLSSIPQSLGFEPNQSISFFLFADANAKVNLATPAITPFFSDQGYGNSDDQNSVVSNGTSTGIFKGNKYTFASTQPPVLLTAKTDLTYPYAGQPNVDPFLQQIKLQFNTNVGSFDRGGSGNAELWSQNSNKKVADLIFNSSQSLAVPSTTVSNAVDNTYPTLLYDIVDPITQLPLTQPLNADGVYFVKLIKGNYDAVSGIGQGITDFGFNFYGGISSNSTLYFKISSANAPSLANAKSSFNTTSIGTVTTSLDQFGTAFFLIVKKGDPAPTKSEMLDTNLPAAYTSAHPLATVGASGTYQVTTINANQTHVFTATNFQPSQAYDVYIIAENDAVSHGAPNPVVATGVYGSALASPAYAAGAAGPTTTIAANTIASNINTITPNLSNSNFQICPDSYSTISSPIIIAETQSGSPVVSFSAPYVQDFNILLPTGYQFDVTVQPTVQLFGADFQPLSSTGPATSAYKYTSNTVLNISFNNPTSSNPNDYIVITGLSVIGKSGSSQGNINWFYGNNVFTNTPAYASPTFSLGTIALLAASPLDFVNSYWQDNKALFNAIEPPSDPNAVPPTVNLAGDALNKTVNAIPDNFQDKDFPGQLQLIPTQAGTGDYLASFFSGNGVSGDLFTLNSVATGAPFNITITHTDLNGCVTQKPEQYVVYDHRNPISNKLGLAYPAPSPLAGTQQAIVNTNWPGSANAINSSVINDNELAGYKLKQLTVDLPSDEIGLNNPISPLLPSASQFISGAYWRTLIKNSILKVNTTPLSYTWDYSAILNASSAIVDSTLYRNINKTVKSSGVGPKDVYDYFKSTNTTPVQKSTYWQGGFLGNIEFTGVYQSTADNSVYAPFRQNVGLFVPAVPALDVTTTTFDKSDQATGIAGVTVQSLGTTAKIYGGNYPGTAIYCEQGGPINISGYPLATAGVSGGVFGIYDYASYDFTKVFVPSGIIWTQSGSTTVYGVNTLFSTELKAGATLYDPQGNIIGEVASFVPGNANTQLTLKAPTQVIISSNAPSTFRANLNQPIAYAAANTAFVDNANGSMTLSPFLLDNSNNNIGITNRYKDILVTYTYQENSSPAFGIGYLVIRVTANPVASFTIASTVANPGPSTTDAFCSNSPITFSSSTSTLADATLGNTIGKYAWTFGDQNAATGNLNTDSNPSPTHKYKSSATYAVTLILTSQWGCRSDVNPVILSNTNSQTKYDATGGNVIVGDVPTPSFSVTRNCVTDPITFDPTLSSVTGNSTISKYKWDYNFQTPANGLPNPIPANASLTSATGASTVYSKSGFYNVLLTTITTRGCQNSDTTTISQLDVISAFNNNFDGDDGGWQALDLAPSFQTPAKPILTSTDPASKTSWVWDNTSNKTNTIFNTSGTNKLWSASAANEKSALYSACLDINVPRPMISYDSYVDVTNAGLVLQYSTDDLNIMDAGKSWTNLGTISTATNPSPGIDWFNAVAIPSTPGSSLSNPTQTGWSGRSNKWIQPKHSLDIVAGQHRVILRFAFSSLPSNINTDGVAIDNIFFGSRTRTILFENFTTTDDGGNPVLKNNLPVEADSITQFVQKTIGQTQLVNINYHVGFIGMDPFSMDNPADPSSRALYYNVSKVPYAFLDGVHYRDSTKTPPSDLFKDWGRAEYDLNTLKLAKADFLDSTSNSNAKPTKAKLNADGSIQVDVNFTPVFDLPFGVRGGTVLQVAILEKDITTVPTTGNVTTGETSFGYVLKKMLPDAAGTKFKNPIKAGVQVSAGSFTWLPEKLHNSNMLTVVVFLQNEDTKEVYQAFAKDVPAPGVVTAIEPITADNIKVYPNPSDQEFTIELPSPAQQNMKVTMANQLGQFTEMGTLGEGTQSKRISTQGLAEGVYILQLGSNGNALRTKVVVLHK